MESKWLEDFVSLAETGSFSRSASSRHVTTGVLPAHSLARSLADHCVAGIEANHAVLEERVRNSVGLATALNPYIGYENTTLIAQLALVSGRRVEDLVLERGLLDAAQLRAILRPEVLTRPHARIVAGEKVVPDKLK